MQCSVDQEILYVSSVISDCMVEFPPGATVNIVKNLLIIGFAVKHCFLLEGKKYYVASSVLLME